jgi:hypothetical protein
MSVRSILTLVALSLTLACVSSPPEEEQIEVRQGAATWDTTERPIPKAFLHPIGQGSNLNRCCVGGTSTSCDKNCATDNYGLITQEGYDKAATDYYVATGEGTFDTLEGWKAFYGFLPRKAGETLKEFRARTSTVVYYNVTELGLGRELGCHTNANTDIGCYVTNFGATFSDMAKSLPAAVAGKPIRNTVVISWGKNRPTGYKVQFAAFGPNGNRINKAQLDNQGARPLPQICMSCHGGRWDADKQGSGSKFGLAKDARFLPLMTNTVAFSSDAGYTLADQEKFIAQLNDVAYQQRSDTLTGRQQDYLNKTYTFASGHLKEPQNPSAGVPVGWGGHESFYRSGAQPFCDTCHMARDTQHTTRTVAQSQAGNWTPDVSSMMSQAVAAGWATFKTKLTTQGWSDAYMGVYGLADPAKQGTYNTDAWSSTATTMPHSEAAFARLWADTAPGACTIGGTLRPAIDCFMTELGIWPNKQGMTHPFIPQTAKAVLDSDCGQSNAGAIGPTVGTNAGRINKNNGLPGMCIDGCRRSVAWCTGSEGNVTNEFPGARLECVPSDTQLGTCKACGEIEQPVCTKVGAGCDVGFNPSCTINLPCHEGVASGGVCSTTDQAAGNGLLQDPSNLKVWTMDMFAIARTKEIDITGATTDVMKGAIVQGSVDGVNFLDVPYGRLDSTAVGSSRTSVFMFPKPIDLRVLRITVMTTSTTAFTVTGSVVIPGWRPLNIGGGDIVCTNACINKTTHVLQCGGNGCSGFGPSCCQGAIRSAGKFCNGNPAANAPCILP